MKSIFPFLSLYRTHWGRLLLGIVLAITGLTASIGLLSLSGWFLSASFLAGSAIIFNFFYPSSGVRGLAIGRTISRYFERLVTHDATFRVLANLRVTVFRKLIPLSPSGLNRFRNSELLNRLVADVDTLDTLYLNLMSPFVSAIMLIVFMGIGLTFVSPLLALVICGSLTVLLIIFPMLFYRLGRKSGAIVIQARANYRSQFIEWIQMHAEFLLFGVVGQATNKLNQTEKEWLNAQSKESRLTGLSNALLIFSNGILVCVVIYLASTAINVPSAEYPEALIALVVFCVMASAEILMPIGLAFLHLGQVITAAERLNEITEQQPSVSFGSKNDWQKIEQNRPLVQFENVTFTYPNRIDPVLQNISFEICAGQKVAILGKTGSGKSTIFQLLNRNYDPTSGQIRLNACNIADYAEPVLRQHIVTLSQRVHIFNSSLRDNLLFGDAQATDSRLITVLNQVGLAYLLDEQGLDLWLGEGGRPLSGGEQRRLGLARLLLSQAEIVLLDEPTEGLDRETEQQILALILTHCQNRTLLMITHRLHGLDKFDNVYRMDNGKFIN
ncbi:heme ABC transporter ATP-binding protein/permease CydC [Actinobacillus pleuropneumoniae]|uniref:Glutathione/L-cysteine transport system ATP-binding/permease protein CydC n=1 Tax=Actinobacillus pleuropneumoniae serovar 6 str. Femo TaxID=754256 RepID=A0A828PKI4_ACTPL|nr:cysteine/glutathione ABC transporter ATP-binding protein/permease CydC [Actinobacillus pleuropneumoniae]EFL80036.1 cysteine/glutathione ABC transporter membrane/ATP-binding component [Actinobacillus pleuropneumoniae serovar 6 str. Femo]EFM92058.1 ABC transporter, CydDC cysteine exporter [Actinobacillus pleuropneumoniae serovar 6 str. Femo]UKH13418.1 cysteine/glutathione ABC transporter ATP-binding protein/permease CydC [Actinobacillus pleuropneumoniae serovar 6 str. Femo]SUU63460.1 cysteine/